MRYGVNLYAERGEKGRAARRAVGRGVRLGLIAGLGVILIGFQIASGYRLNERAGELEEGLSGLRARLPVEPSAEDSPEAAVLQRARIDRVVWYPKLEAIADVVPNDMFVSQIGGTSSEGGAARRSLSFTGHVFGEEPDLAPALRMVESLKRTPHITDDFPAVDVNTARGTLLLTVEITCGETARGSAR